MEVLRKRIIVFFVILSYSTLVELLKNKEIYTKVHGCQHYVPISNQLLDLRIEASMLKCAIYCLNKLICGSFAYNKNDRQCWLSRRQYSSCNTDQLNFIQGAQLYKVDAGRTKVNMLHFPMDTIIGDILLGDINATVYNNPQLVPGIYNNAVSFNGIDQRAQLGVHDCFSDISTCNDGNTYAIWLKLSSSVFDGSTGIILSSGGNAREVIHSAINIHTHNGNLISDYVSRPSGKRWRSSFNFVLIDTWFHFAITWNKNGSLNVYINGTLTSTVISQAFTFNSPVGISDMTVAAHSNDHLYKSEITVDEWYFWGYELEENAIKILFESY